MRPRDPFLRRGWTAVLVAAGCAVAPALPAARFANAPVVTVVDDRHDVSRLPDVYVDLQNLEFYDAAIERPITRALELPLDQRALGVNAVDEVPDSTWFTNRITTHELTPDEIRSGPMTIESPELHTPWTVHSTKIGGDASAGLIVTDARGVKYMIKFDDPAMPEAETGTHIVVNRLLWASGYNVPEDVVVYLRPADFLVAPDAKVKDRIGNTVRALRREEIDRSLAMLPRRPDGRFRALASRWLDGKPLGGAAAEGVRAGDPNDRIRHEERRDLRGAQPIMAWVDHVEPTRSNFLDMWVADGKRHYVKHYLIDFGRSMGVKADENHDWRQGHVLEVDYADMMRSVVTFGVGERAWGHHVAPVLRGVSTRFVADDFDPGAWVPGEPYVPFDAADRFDKFWGARIVATFTRAQIHAAVEAAQFSDPRAVAYLTDTLVARQRAIAAYWFARVNPIDHIAIVSAGTGAGLCFDDLAIGSALTPFAETRYAIASHDARERLLAPVVALSASPGGRTCTPALVLAGERDGYTIVAITTTRLDFTGTTYVHLARDPGSQRPRVIGIWRI